MEVEGPLGGCLICHRSRTRQSGIRDHGFTERLLPWNPNGKTVYDLPAHRVIHAHRHNAAKSLCRSNLGKNDRSSLGKFHVEQFPRGRCRRTVRKTPPPNPFRRVWRRLRGPRDAEPGRIRAISGARGVNPGPGPSIRPGFGVFTGISGGCGGRFESRLQGLSGAPVGGRGSRGLLVETLVGTWSRRWPAMSRACSRALRRSEGPCAKSILFHVKHPPAVLDSLEESRLHLEEGPRTPPGKA